jgi:hypothetical protein
MLLGSRQLPAIEEKTMKTQPSILSRVLPLIPEREPRFQTGTRFALPEMDVRHGAQVAQLARFLQWLTPLNPMSKEEQQGLGLGAPRARLLEHGEEDEPDSEREESGPVFDAVEQSIF